MTLVQCADGRSLQLHARDGGITVFMNGEALDLDARPSSFGQHYVGPGGTLRIDDRFVAFVPKGDGSWFDCHISAPDASAPR